MIDVQAASLLTAGSLILIGMAAIVFVDNVIKKIIGALFITDGVNLALVAIGYRAGGIVPIVTEKVGGVACQYPGLSEECISAFGDVASYPLPYALVLTSIVIGAATTAVMLGLAIRLFQKYNTLSAAVILGEDDAS